jgi:hypothetical protein
VTYAVAYRKAKEWQKKVKIIAVYHTIRCVKKKSWRVRDTAEYFKLSIGNVSENLYLAENWSKIREMGSRNKALKHLRGLV